MGGYAIAAMPGIPSTEFGFAVPERTPSAQRWWWATPVAILDLPNAGSVCE